jgi:putative SOS response-associated peptidase YedK
VKPDGAVVESCTIITMPANALMHDIHNTGNNPHRMPAMLHRADWQTWLSGSVEDAKGLLRQYPSELMVAHGVSTKVNAPKNQGPELIAPV